MSIINEALRKTQLSRKNDKEKPQQQEMQVRGSFEPGAECHPESRQEPNIDVKAESQVVEPAKPTKNAEPAQVSSSEPKVVKKSEFQFTWKMASMLTVAAMLAIMFYVSQQQNAVAPRKYLPNIASSAPSKTKISFEGVFLSDETKIAVINKKSMHVGDTVNGMQIVAINQDTIDLQNANGTIELKAGATYLL